MFCDAYSDYIRYTRIIAEDGDTTEYTNKSEVTNIVPHPLITKKAQAFQQMDRMMSKFGLSPVDRSKLIQAMHPPEEEEDEKFGNRL
jgi:P27 family predicted phage terminase small subunit